MSWVYKLISDDKFQHLWPESGLSQLLETELTLRQPVMVTEIISFVQRRELWNKQPSDLQLVRFLRGLENNVSQQLFTR